MPRSARKRSNTGIYHIMARGINRQSIFKDDADKEKLLMLFKRYKKPSDYEIYGYCLMDNHIHLLIKEKGEPLSTFIKKISGSYVHWYNMKYNRCGHLFQERFKSEVVEDEEYFLTVLRYIHQNPVKAGLTENVGDYSWSSYKEYLDKTIIANIDFALDLLSTHREEALREFIKFMNKANEDKCLEYEERLKVTDNDVVGYLNKLGIKNENDLRKIEKTKRNEIIKVLKAIDGVTIRQLSRITGIAKSIIDRV